MPVITLLTDFGNQDTYVGVMKGVIAGICPDARIIDLTHAIPPQDIAAARFTLLNAYPYFPDGTIHTVVVDPGVGTLRRAVAVQTANGYLVGPDNGVLSGVVSQMGAIAAVSLSNPTYWCTSQPSQTFHGRDIFAPVAAHLAAGVSLSQLGTPIALDSLVQHAPPIPQIQANSAIGHVQYIDHFGNLITTLPENLLQQGSWIGRVGKTDIPVGKTYGDVELGQAVAIAGSHGWVEIAVNGGSAQQQFSLKVGDEVQLYVSDRAVSLDEPTP
ncbi:MAG: SAM-dependent chlorinase/fluorinase [Cyanobacteria bacterium J06638_28]